MNYNKIICNVLNILKSNVDAKYSITVIVHSNNLYETLPPFPALP